MDNEIKASGENENSLAQKEGIIEFENNKESEKSEMGLGPEEIVTIQVRLEVMKEKEAVKQPNLAHKEEVVEVFSETNFALMDNIKVKAKGKCKRRAKEQAMCLITERSTLNKKRCLIDEYIGNMRNY